MFVPGSVVLLESTLRDTIEARIPSDVSLSMNDPEISVSGGRALIEISELRMQKSGHFSASAAGLRAVVDMQSIVTGDLQPSRIEIRNMRISLDRSAIFDSSESAMVQADQGFVALRSSLETMLRRTGDLHRAVIGAGPEEFRIARLEIAGGADLPPLTGQAGPITISELLWCESCNNGNAGKLSFAIGDGLGSSLPHVDILIPPGEVSAIYAVSGLPAAAFVKIAGVPEGEISADSRVDLRLEMNGQAEGSLQSANLRLNVGPGDLTLSGRAPIRIKTADALVSLEADNPSIRVDRISLQTDKAEISANGEVEPGSLGGPVRFVFDLAGSRFAGPGDKDVIALQSANVIGTVELQNGPIIHSSGAAKTPTGTVSFEGVFASSGSEPGLKAELRTDGADAAMVFALWPPVVASEAKSWFRNNVKSARFGPGTLRLDLPLEHIRAGAHGLALPDDGISGEVSVQSARFSPLADMPSINGSSGLIRFRNATLDVEMVGGTITDSAFGSASIEQARFQIPNLGTRNSIGYLDLSMSGPAAALADLSNAGRLEFATSRNIEPSAVSGDAKLALFAQLPLSEGGREVGAEVEFDLQLTDFATEADFSGGRSLTDGSLKLAGSLGGYALSGNVLIDGVPVAIRAKSDDGRQPRIIRIVLDAASWNALGFSPAPYLQGPVIAKVRTDINSSQRFTFDLSSAAIQVPLAGWHKPAGDPASFEADIVRSERGTTISDFSFYGEGFDVAGDLDVDQQGRIKTFAAHRIRLNEDDDYALKVTREDNAWALDLSGRSFDSRGFMALLGEGAAAGIDLPASLAVSVQLDSIKGHNETTLKDVRGNARMTAGDLQELDMEVESGSLALSPETGASTRQLTASYGNAGELLRFLGIHKTLYGGRFSFAMSDGEDARDHGQVNFTGFRVHQSGRTLDVSRLTIPFVHKTGSVHISRARMTADGLRATARGNIDLEAKRMAVRGTIVPTNGLNQLPAALPIIGDMLGARKRNGLIGIAFTLAGPLSSPHLKLNVASAVTPGIVRRIFNPP